MEVTLHSFECQSQVCAPPSPKADSPASPTPDSPSFLASQATDSLLPPVVSLTTKSKHQSLHVKKKTEGEVTFSVYLTLHKFLCGHEDTNFSCTLCTYVCKYMIVVVFEVAFEYMHMLHIKIFLGNGRNNCILTNCLFNRQRSESGRSIRN